MSEIDLMSVFMKKAFETTDKIRKLGDDEEENEQEEEE